MNRTLELERQNLVNWYPFKDGARVLVLSEDRGIYNYFASKGYCTDYVECSCGKFEQARLEKKYDYIVIDGVLAYASSYCSSSNPYKEMLCELSACLNADGTILMATPNRLGLKYLCGAPEQYTGALGVGLNGYEFANNVKTFTKRELRELVSDCGYANVKFYYPYPDYEYPREIYTDETITMESYGKDYAEMISDRLLIYNEGLIANELAKENVAANFANSFLVELSHTNIDDGERPSYVKINSDRNDKFQISTAFIESNNQKYVVKAPVSKAAISHIRNLHGIEMNSDNDRYCYLKGEYNGNSLKYIFLKDETLDDIIEKCIEREDIAGVAECLDNMFDCLLNSQSQMLRYDTEQFINVFGDTKLENNNVRCVKPANIDLICSNVFICDSVYTIIDGEWTFDFGVPIAFIIWRSLNELFYAHKGLSKIISREMLNEKYGITADDEVVYKEWNRFFTLEYVGANKLECVAKNKYQISLDDVLKKEREKNRINSSLYFDYGDGFKEDNKLYSENELSNGEFEIKYDVKNFENVRRLRWDPTENVLCKCFAEVNIDGKWIRMLPENASSIGDEWDIFKTMDPRYTADGLELNDNVLTIRGRINYLDVDLMPSIYSELELKCEKCESEVQIKNALLIAETDSKGLIRKYTSMLERDYDALIEENEELNKKVQLVQEQVDKVEAERDAKAEFEMLYNKVISSKGWRMLEKLRKIKRIIKR